jgi:hypothetical protein
MDWCVTPDRRAANHAPLAVVEPSLTTAKPGSRVRLQAGASRDPDGDKLSWRWFIYKEAGTFEGEIPLTTPSSDTVEFVAPAVTEPRTLHVILEVTDDGQPPLTRYGRAVVTLVPVASADAAITPLSLPFRWRAAAFLPPAGLPLE